jgi:hypothetical protein
MRRCRYLRPSDRQIDQRGYRGEVRERSRPKPDQTWKGEERLAQVCKDYATGRLPGDHRDSMSGARYFALLPEVEAEAEAEEKELEAARQEWIARTHAVSARPTNIHAEWDRYTLTEPRAYIEDVLLAVIVNPANDHYGTGFVPIWRGVPLAPNFAARPGDRIFSLPPHHLHGTTLPLKVPGGT